MAFLDFFKQTYQGLTDPYAGAREAANLATAQNLIKLNRATTTAVKPPTVTSPTYGNTAATSPKQTYINNQLPTSSFQTPTSTSLPSSTGNYNNNFSAPSINTTATPEVDPLAAYKSAYQKYIDSLAPSPEVTKAKQAYLDYVTNANLGIANLEGQGRGIPLQLVRGQQEKLGKQAEIEASRLQGDIGIAQEAQTAAQNQAKAGIDYQAAIKTYGEDALDKTAVALLAQLRTLPDKQSRDAYIIKKSNELGLSIDAINSALQKAQISEPIKLGEGDVLFDPITGKPIYKNPKTFSPNELGVGNPLGLTNQQIDNISPVAQSFRNEPIVQQFNTIAEGYNFIKSLGNTTTNPADDQALIYAFAKAMDPNSVVREGEYATVQKYAQSLISSYGKSVSQAINGTGFLSPEARTNLKKTIESKYNASQQNYQNVYNEYLKRISAVGGVGNDVAQQFLTNYGAAFGSGGNPDDIINQYLGFNSVGNTSASIKLGSPLARANNNPGNLRYAGQAGATMGQGGFARFVTPQAGLKALQNQIALDASRGLTLASFINKYAPPSENNTRQYINQATVALGVSPNTRLSSINLSKLTAFIARKESSTTLV